MKLSPLFESLVFIEHKKKVEIADLANLIPVKSIKGVIGKMEALGLIKKDEEGYIKLSVKGHHYLNDILFNLHKPISKWNGFWTIVSFSIPEKDRSKRDRLRRFLESIGMKTLFNSIWISPLDLRADIYEYIKLNNLKNKVLIARSNSISGIDIKAILSLWNFDVHRALLDDFISNASAPIPKKVDPLLEVKRRIFSFALILQKQPKVPMEIFPKDWPYLRAKMAYKKLRSRIP